MKVEKIVPLVSLEVHHPAIGIELMFTHMDENHVSLLHGRPVFCFSKADFVAIEVCLRRVDWTSIFAIEEQQVMLKFWSMYNLLDDERRHLILQMQMFELIQERECLHWVDYNVIIFYFVIYDIVLQHVPYQLLKEKKYPVWFDVELRQSLCVKMTCYDQWKKAMPNVRDEKRLLFEQARRNFKRMHKLKLDGYLCQIEQGIKERPKNFWNFVKSLTRSRDLPKVMTFSGRELSDPQSIAEAFADFFEKVYCPFSGTCPEIMPFLDVELQMPDFRADKLLKRLSTVDVGKGPGPDLLAPLLFKRCADVLVHPLSFVFNQCLQTGVFPVIWKISHVVPIFKKGNRNAVENHRGVAIQSFVPKLLESELNEALMNHVAGGVVSHQHGFISGRSTVTNLLEFNYKVKMNMEAGGQMDTFYLDFSKAFDRVPHGILSSVIEAFGVTGRVHNLLMSYVSERLQSVKVAGRFSRGIEVTSGVPQGSHIGPTLFVMFINSLPRFLKDVDCIGYADDYKIFKSVTCQDDCQILQDAIDAASNWSSLFGLELNSAKCVVMSHTKKRVPVSFSYSLNGQPLQRVKEFNDLGVIFVEQGSFGKHMSLKTTKGLSMLGFLRRTCIDFKDSSTLLTIFSAHVRSHVEYASSVWFPYHKTDVSCLERVQRRFTLYAMMKNGSCTFETRPSYNDRCASLGLQSLEARRIVNCCMLSYDILTGRTDSFFLRNLFVLKQNRESSRFNETFMIPFRRTDYGRFEPTVVMLRMLNECARHLSLRISRTNDGFYDFGMTREQFKDKTWSWLNTVT